MTTARNIIVITNALKVRRRYNTYSSVDLPGLIFNTLFNIFSFFLFVFLINLNATLPDFRATGGVMQPSDQQRAQTLHFAKHEQRAPVALNLPPSTLLQAV